MKNIKFEINKSGNFVSIVFYRPKISEKMPNSAEKLLKLVENEQEEKVINFLIENKKIDVNQAGKLLNLKERKAREILKKLVDKEILKKIGKTKRSYYMLNEK